VLALGAALTGCGNDSKADLANGKTLFIEKCGGCHQLARAGTSGTVGPNLDDAFDRARIDGMATSVEGIVKKQIELPTQDLYPKSLVMPANLVTGMDARDVAAYVAYAAAAEGKDTGTLADVGGGTDGAGLFKTNCASCHVLAAAAASGTAGPDLDTLKPSLKVTEKQVTNGGGGMPAFGGTLSKEQIALIAKFVSDEAGK
jgi:mono/diheme cytochrome c family protein